MKEQAILFFENKEKYKFHYIFTENYRFSIHNKNNYGITIILSKNVLKTKKAKL